MSPREDLTSLAAIEDLLETTHAALASPLPFGQEDAKRGIDFLDAADRDIVWHVDPTDTSDVFELVLHFADDLRSYIEAIGGGAGGSQFKDNTLLDKAHSTVGLLRKHQKLCKDYEASVEVRRTRPIHEQAAELDDLSGRGSEALKTLRNLIAGTSDYLRRIM